MRDSRLWEEIGAGIARLTPDVTEGMSPQPGDLEYSPVREQEDRERRERLADEITMLEDLLRAKLKRQLCQGGPTTKPPARVDFTMTADAGDEIVGNSCHACRQVFMEGARMLFMLDADNKFSGVYCDGCGVKGEMHARP